MKYRGLDEEELRIGLVDRIRGLSAIGSGLVVLVDEAHAASKTFRRTTITHRGCNYVPSSSSRAGRKNRLRKCWENLN